MFYSIPVSSQIVTQSPIEAKSITHVFFENKNDNAFQWKENPDTISISIDGKQIARNILVTPFMTSTSCGRGHHNWQDVALEVGLNVNMSEIKITSNSNTNDYSVVFVCSDTPTSESGVDYVEWKRFVVSKQLGGQQLQSLVLNLILDAEQRVRNRIVNAHSEAVSDWTRYTTYLSERDANRHNYFNSIKSVDNKYIDNIKLYIETFYSLYDNLFLDANVSSWDCEEFPQCDYTNAQSTYDSAIRVYHWYNKILLPFLDYKAYDSIDHFFSSSYDEWDDIKPNNWDNIKKSLSAYPQFYLSEEETQIADTSEGAPIQYDTTSDVFQTLKKYWLNFNDTFTELGFDNPIFNTYAEYEYCGKLSVKTVDEIYKIAREMSPYTVESYYQELFGERIKLKSESEGGSNRSKTVYPLSERYKGYDGNYTSCMVFYMGSYFQFSMLGKKSNVGFNIEHQFLLDYPPRQFFCVSQCHDIINMSYDKNEASYCPNPIAFSLLCGDNVDMPTNMDMALVSISDYVPMRKAIYNIEDASRGISITFTNIDPNSDKHDDWDIYIVFISKRLV